MPNVQPHPINLANRHLLAVVQKLSMQIARTILICFILPFSFVAHAIEPKASCSYILGIPTASRTDSHRSQLEGPFSPKTLLGKYKLKALGSPEQLRAFERPGADSIVMDLWYDQALSGLQKKLSQLSDQDIWAALDAFGQPGQHGVAKDNESLYAQAIVEFILPPARIAKNLLRYASDKDQIQAVKSQLDSLVKFQAICAAAAKTLNTIENPSPETIRLKDTLTNSARELWPAAQAVLDPRDGIFDRIGRLLDGDIKTGFQRGMSSKLDNLRRDLALWESKREALKKSIVALSELDAYLAISRARSQELGQRQQWIKEVATPMKDMTPSFERHEMEGVGKLIGDAKIVAVGESTHDSHDFPRMRLKILNYLATEKGFTGLVIESGLVESEILDRFVQGDPAISLDYALKEGFTHNFGEATASRELLIWLKEYNRNKSDQNKIHLYGMDLTNKGDYLSKPLARIGEYLAKVDPSYFSKQFQTLVEIANEADAVTTKVEKAFVEAGQSYIDPDLLDGFTSVSYEQLGWFKQKRLQWEIFNLRRLLKSKQNEYLQKSSSREIAWIMKMADLLAQNLTNFKSRQASPRIPNFKKIVEILRKVYGNDFSSLKIDGRHFITNSADPTEWMNTLKGRESREKGLSENIEWAARMSPRVLVYAHNGHVMKTSKIVTIGALTFEDSTLGAGQFLARSQKENYVVIGGTMDSFVDEAGKSISSFHWGPVVPTRKCDGCIETALWGLDEGTPAHFVDFSRANDEMRTWLSLKLQNRWQGNFQRYSPLQAFDGLIYIRNAHATEKPK